VFAEGFSFFAERILSIGMATETDSRLKAAGSCVVG